MGLHGADARGCSGETRGVVRGSPRRGWLQIDVVVSGDALWCTDVRPRVGESIYISNPRRMAHTWNDSRGSHGNAAGISV